MAIVTGDRYLESLVKFVEEQAGPLIEGSLVLKLNPVGLHYVHSRLEALSELESLLSGAPVDYLRAYVSDLGDHRALEQLRRILRLLTSLKVVSMLPPPARDPTPLSLLPFGRLKVLELRGCDLSTSAARGLIELRHTLEKLICHNSTDALRHVFASRIAEIKESPQWNRLSFVSCACNGLVLMDESLQLLPVVENLDLSRNRFAKVDNLWKCTKLKHLDLGFNHLRTMSSFSEVALQIVKLILRNNALTTLRGIENLKFLVALDLSYNIISNLAELEIIAGLPSLQSFWLEGNPLCCIPWYRAQVFSFFPHPHKLKLDEKHISTRESWQRRIIIASRQKHPASFGFYSPAKDGAEFKGSINIKRKKLSRLASIETEEQSTAMSSDQESVPCDNEIQCKEENVISDDDAEINDLMHRIEYMKKECSILWLQEFREWMNQLRDNFIDSSKYSDPMPNPEKENYFENKIKHKHQGETSRYVSDSIQPSGDESSTNILDSDNSFADTCISGCDPQHFDRLSEAASKLYMGHSGRDSVPFSERMNSDDGHMKSFYNETSRSVKARNSFIDSFAVAGDRMGGKNISMYLTTIDEIIESHSSSACPGSPPHYQDDILHRRQNLEEEFLQLSAESLSMVSSDSDTSNSEDDSAEIGPLMPQVGLSLVKLSESMVDYISMSDSGVTCHEKKNEISWLAQNGACSLDRQTLGALAQLGGNTLSVDDGEIVHLVKQEDGFLQKKNHKRRPKRRLVSLSEDSVCNDTEPSQNLNERLNVCRGVAEGDEVHLVGDSQNPVDKSYTWKSAITTSLINSGGTIVSETKSFSSGREDFIENYFNSNVADFGVNETCRQYIFCNFIHEEKSGFVESEGAILLSSEHKIYVLLITKTYDGSGTSLKLMGHHRVEDVKEVLVGLGLQIVRLFIERDTTYLFITRSIEKCRQLLSNLGFFDSHMIKNNFTLRSMEQAQVNLFEKNVCGSSKRSIFQYAMVLFWRNNLEEDLWLSRSLFVLGQQLFMCVEDFMQFGSLSDDASSSSYFVLDSCCSIADVCEMVIEAAESRCVTLALECALPGFCAAHKANKVEDTAPTVEKPVSGQLTWKIKWFSEESLFNFVVLLKAFHAAVAESPLVVRCIS